VRTASISCSGGVVFEHESARAGAECFVDVFVESEGGEDQDPRGVVGGNDPAGGLEPVELWHADVHQDHGRVKPRRLGHRFQSVACFGDDFHVLFAGEQHSEAGADHGLVVGDEDSDRHGRSGVSRRRVLSVNPPPFVVPAVISPP
jgi:hypothetical protein